MWVERGGYWATAEPLSHRVNRLGSGTQGKFHNWQETDNCPSTLDFEHIFGSASHWKALNFFKIIITIATTTIVISGWKVFLSYNIKTT